ncbi:MAG: WYL domain-containing protein [Photobacterium halotolerans]
MIDSACHKIATFKFPSKALTLTLPSGKTELAVVEMLRFGPDVQVIQPETLRLAMKNAIDAMFQYYIAT